MGEEMTLKLGYPVDPKVFPITGTFHEQYTNPDGSVYYHGGVDFGVPIGTDIVAAGDGIAELFYASGGWQFGNWVRINHGVHDSHTLYTAYAHSNGEFYIENGQRVKRGQRIMQSGNTGKTTGPHLHWGLVKDEGGFPLNFNYLLNPIDYIGPAEEDGAEMEELRKLIQEQAARITELEDILIPLVRCAVANGVPGSPIAELIHQDTDNNLNLRLYCDNLNTALREVKKFVNMPLGD